jgi:hypothetical protein
VYDKETMKDIMVSDTARAQLIGRLYFEEDLLNSEQLSIIKQQIHNPTYEYNADKKSLWSLYNHITYSLRASHPKNWLDNQRLVHWFFTQEYGIKLLDIQEQPNQVTEITPETIVINEPIQVLEEVKQPTNQLDLLDVIKEIEDSEGNLNHL